ncbi:hypothetical protein [Mycolicibacterium lutetiense]|uniref:Uncharacterized protein n=1 Tax=Mycolicibacterium lutetiense TaxID=1641992 RepID=A0ABS4ZLY8_9MYCO|nr:hypothetical protein [Mycolicibacterium lutetiense]MBP2450507.1 hypothetical protein [Mycolicibacterium lutetiense]
MNEDEFWSATDQIKLIHQWARASYVAPWALLCAVLLRVIASTGHPVMLPGPPAPASLNMGLVLIGRSGSGKGVTDKLSRVVWPADIHEEGLGSGQGIAELFKEQKDPEDRITRALISVSEIDHLSALNAGQGNNTRAAIKAALTGDRLGSKGASSATSRSVPADSYRLCLSISAQFGHCGVLLDDVSGGTPQRQLWVLVTDPDMPEEPGPTPDRVLDTALPSWALSGSQTLIQYGTPEIREYVAAGLLANQRGQLDAIDGHRTLTRLKVAAALAILDHRMVVSGVDWELSDHIMAKSDATRAAVLEYDRQAARAKLREKSIAKAVGEEIIDDRRTEVVRRRIFRILSEGPATHGTVHSRIGKREYKELFPDVIASLLRSGEVLAEELPRGKRYSLSTGVKVDPRVKDDIPSSDRLTLGVKVDPGATITDLDSRRSHDSERPKVSCRKWFEEYVSKALASGATRLNPFAVIAAGEAYGYKEQNIRVAASAHADITAVRDERTTWWSLTGERLFGPSKVLTDYLEQLPANTTEVDQNDYYAYAERNGIERTLARKTAVKSELIESVPAHGASQSERRWLIRPPVAAPAEGEVTA